MIYLDNAATSYPKPECVTEQVVRVITECGGNPGRSGHRLSLAASEVVFRTRSAVAKHIGAKSEENIIFTQNATYAINTILRAKIKAGSHVLLSDMEHNSVWRPIWRLAQDGLITYSLFSHEGDICRNIQEKLTRKTDILICTHISNVNGFVFPLEEISSFCRARGIYMIVDASQSIGHRAVTVDKIDCDALCAPGHKGLYGIQGSGFFYVREAQGLKDVFQGGSGAHSLSPEMPDYLPDRFEAGTLSTPAIASLGAGIAWVEAQGVENIENREQSFSRRLHEYLSDLPNVILYSKPESGIVAFNIAGVPADEVAERLDGFGICVRGGYHCSPLAHRALGTPEGGLVRISAGAFNTMGEAEVTLYRLLSLSKEYAAQGYKKK